MKDFLVEERLMKYVPKKISKYITTLYEQCPHTYSICLEIDGEEYCGICDSVAEIRYAANVMNKERRDYGI